MDYLAPFLCSGVGKKLSIRKIIQTEHTRITVILHVYCTLAGRSLATLLRCTEEHNSSVYIYGYIRRLRVFRLLLICGQ